MDPEGGGGGGGGPWVYLIYIRYAICYFIYLTQDIRYLYKN